MINNKVWYEVRNLTCFEELTKEGENKLVKKMKKEGYELEDKVALEDFSEENKTVYDYRFAKYYKV